MSTMKCGGSSKKEGKMRIRAFPVSVYSLIQLNSYIVSETTFSRSKIIVTYYPFITKIYITTKVNDNVVRIIITMIYAN